MQEYKGKITGNNLRIGIVVARFNELITRSLLTGALDGLERYGIPTHQTTVAWVPGAYEIPLIAKQLATSQKFDAIICLGAVIRGATAHFDFVAGHAASGIAQVALETNIPVIFGVLTTDTLEQAMERAGSKAGNKGFEAVQTAIEMIDLQRQLRKDLASDVKQSLEAFSSAAMSHYSLSGDKIS
jgi:6,7-dimethyl-8-ribityllumazine synthase